MSTRPQAPRAAVAAFGTAAALAGCAAALDVRSVGTGVGEPPAFQLSGRSLAALDAQTRALCPGGHQVLRQWQKLHRQPLAPPALADWVAERGGSVQDAVSRVLDDGEAQMTVQCQPAAAPVVAAAAAAASAASSAP